MKLLKLLLVILCSILLAIIISNIHISSFSKNCHSDTSTIEPSKVGLLLGTSKYLRSGGLNPYYQHRIDAALQLYNNSKIKFILVSGDNSTNKYNEPKMFKEDLMSLGIPEERIYLDYAGFRTYDSVIRAQQVFQEDSLIIISQKFHNERALFLAKNMGIHATGFNAEDVNSRSGFKTRVREFFARFKAVLDIFVLNTKPKFLGEKININ